MRIMAASTLLLGLAFEDSHAEARAAAESFLIEKGINLNWQGKASPTVSVIRPPVRRSA